MTNKSTAKKTNTRKAPTEKPTAKTLIQVSDDDCQTLGSARRRTEAKIVQMGELRMQILALKDQETKLREEVSKAFQHQKSMVETVALKYKIDLDKETWEFVWGDNGFRRID